MEAHIPVILRVHLPGMKEMNLKFMINMVNPGGVEANIVSNMVAVNHVLEVAFGQVSSGSELMTSNLARDQM